MSNSLSKIKNQSYTISSRKTEIENISSSVLQDNFIYYLDKYNFLYTYSLLTKKVEFTKCMGESIFKFKGNIFIINKNIITKFTDTFDNKNITDKSKFIMKLKNKPNKITISYKNDPNGENKGEEDGVIFIEKIANEKTVIEYFTSDFVLKEYKLPLEDEYIVSISQLNYENTFFLLNTNRIIFTKNILRSISTAKLYEIKTKDKLLSIFTINNSYGMDYYNENEAFLFGVSVKHKESGYGNEINEAFLHKFEIVKIGNSVILNEKFVINININKDQCNMINNSLDILELGVNEKNIGFNVLDIFDGIVYHLFDNLIFLNDYIVDISNLPYQIMKISEKFSGFLPYCIKKGMILIKDEMLNFKKTTIRNNLYENLNEVKEIESEFYNKTFGKINEDANEEIAEMYNLNLENKLSYNLLMRKNLSFKKLIDHCSKIKKSIKIKENEILRIKEKIIDKGIREIKEKEKLLREKVEKMMERTLKLNINVEGKYFNEKIEKLRILLSELNCKKIDSKEKLDKLKLQKSVLNSML